MEKIRILVVDDEKIAVRHFQRMLDAESVEYCLVGDAQNGEQALRAVEKLHPDIVFADVEMPVMNGLEFAEEMQKRYPFVRVVLLTAYKEFAYAKKGIEVGVMAYLVKHEVSREQIEELIFQVRQEKEREEEKRRILRDKNVKNYLEYGEEAKELNLGYQGYDFILMNIFVRPPFFLGRAYSAHLIFPLKELEELRTEDIFCKVAVQMTDTSCVMILFKRKGIYEKSNYFQLMSILNQAQNCMVCHGLDALLLVTGEIHQFSGLPKTYERIRTHGAYVYAGEERKILKTQELGNFKSPEKFLREKEQLLKMGEAGDHIEKVFRIGRETCTGNQYVNELNDLAVQIILKGKELKLPESADWEERRNQVFQGVDEAEAWIRKIFKDCMEAQKKVENQRYSVATRKALEYIHEHFAETLTSEELGKKTKLSESHFRRLFKQEVGMRPMEYINEYRIRQAERLLRKEGAYVQEVGEKVGFSSSQYFSTVFKKVTGISPWQYQQKKAGNTYEEKC